MGYRVSRRADHDLNNIYEFSLTQFGPRQARNYGGGIIRTLSFLAEHPESARLRQEVDPPVRVFRFKSHLIFYDIKGDDIVILRVRHGREDWMSDAT